MNPKTAMAILAGSMVVVAAAYLLFLAYALNQMKVARAEGMSKIDTILDGIKNERPADNAT